MKNSSIWGLAVLWKLNNMGLLVHTRVYRPTFPNSSLLSTAIHHGNNVTNNQTLKGNKEANHCRPWDGRKNTAV